MTARALPEGLDWDALAHLEAVERLGTAAAAGRELGVAASTVYRRIAALEASLGLRCFVPGEGVTAVARELASLARETAAGVVAIRRRAREDHGVVRGRVRLTTVDGFMPLLVEPLTALAARHPELELDVLVSPPVAPAPEPPELLPCIAVSGHAARQEMNTTSPAARLGSNDTTGSR